uniref:Endonuclease/exonuclease/phosphatase domain-containing protein n=1 Tax=Plectus sambesii TaxID=2011161 RepID=A0A914XMQ5_9BILA
MDKTKFWKKELEQNAARNRIIGTRTTPTKEFNYRLNERHQVGQKETIARELQRCKVGIAALSELRLTGSGTTVIQLPDSDEYTTLYYSGGSKHAEGVGFALSKQAAASVLCFRLLSSRLATLTLTGTIRTHIFSIYTPTEVSPDSTKDDFYSDLQEAIDSVPAKDLLLLAGDFNAHVGTNRSGWEEILGNFSHGTANDNGLRLLSFASANNLVVGNSLFQHLWKHQVTWRAPNGKDTSVLDYILINKRFRSSLKDVRSMRSADCGSDHHL